MRFHSLKESYFSIPISLPSRATCVNSRHFCNPLLFLNKRSLFVILQQKATKTQQHRGREEYDMGYEQVLTATYLMAHSHQQQNRPQTDYRPNKRLYHHTNSQDFWQLLVSVEPVVWRGITKLGHGRENRFFDCRALFRGDYQVSINQSINTFNSFYSPSGTQS